MNFKYLVADAQAAKSRCQLLHHPTHHSTGTPFHALWSLGWLWRMPAKKTDYFPADFIGMTLPDHSEHLHHKLWCLDWPWLVSFSYHLVWRMVHINGNFSGDPTCSGPLLHSNYYFTGRFLPKDWVWKLWVWIQQVAGRPSIPWEICHILGTLPIWGWFSITLEAFRPPMISARIKETLSFVMTAGETRLCHWQAASKCWSRRAFWEVW